MHEQTKEALDHVYSLLAQGDTGNESPWHQIREALNHLGELIEIDSRPHIDLTAAQLREALDFINPDGPDDKDQMTDSVTIRWYEGWIYQGQVFPSGYYALSTEYPEEGVYGPLGEASQKKEECLLCHDTGMIDQPVAAPAGVEIPKYPKIKCPMCKSKSAR